LQHQQQQQQQLTINDGLGMAAMDWLQRVVFCVSPVSGD
jgi:hypothetical protein